MTAEPDDDALLALFEAIAAGAPHEAVALVKSSQALLHRPIQSGASRREADRYFLTAIRHYVDAGDTAAVLQHGATAADTDAKGTTVAALATGQWIRTLLGVV